MRMRKKPNLAPRMEKCAGILIDDPAALMGRWREVFSGYDNLFLELGCGKGRFTAETARREPKNLLIAVEKVPDAMVVAMERVLELGLENARFIDGDALALPVIFAENEVDRIYINFCDPWPRKKEAKHRLTSPGFLSIYESILKPSGELHFKTDNQPLFEYSVETLQAEGWELSELTYDLHANGPVGVMTDYEAKFWEQGVKINMLTARRAGK